MKAGRTLGILGTSPQIIMNLRHTLALLVSASSLFLTACGTTGSTSATPTAKLAPIDSSIALASAGGDVLSGSFGHEAVGASLLSLSPDDKARQARAQAEFDYRSYVIWKSAQRS